MNNGPSMHESLDVFATIWTLMSSKQATPQVQTNPKEMTVCGWGCVWGGGGHSLQTHVRPWNAAAIHWWANAVCENN